jgi:hypothetical protein
MVCYVECLLPWWNSGFLINLKAFVLTVHNIYWIFSILYSLYIHYIFTIYIYIHYILLHSKIFFSHIISFTSEAALIYSASVIDKATHCYRSLCHVMTAFAYLHTTPDIDLFLCLPHSQHRWRFRDYCFRI